MMKNILLNTLVLTLLISTPFDSFSQKEQRKKETKKERKVNEIYKVETSVINSMPYAEEFHRRYEEYLKQSIFKQLKIRWFDALSAFGEGLQGNTANQNAMASTKLKQERLKIYSDWLNEIKTKNNPIPNENISSTGTGFAISKTGLIATNNHVVNGAKTLNVRGVNGNFNRAYTVNVILQDKNNDLAIIKINDKSFSDLGEIPYLLKQNSSDVGEDIFVLGYPLTATMGDEIKLTNGIISSKSGYQNDVTSYQISAPVQPGNSGGPLFDKAGNLIGIVNAKHIDAENATYAVKVTYLLNLIDLLDTKTTLPEDNILNGKTLSEQVGMIKNFVYLIEVN